MYESLALPLAIGVVAIVAIVAIYFGRGFHAQGKGMELHVDPAEQKRKRKGK